MSTNLAPTIEQQELFAAWRTVALSRMPYMASMLFSVRVLNSPGLGTFAVDADHRMYVDFEEVEKKGTTWCAESLLHEVGHLFADHSTYARELGIPPEKFRVWNLSADLSINDDLVQAGCKTLSDVLPAMIGEPDFQTDLHYYGVLDKMVQQQKQQGGQNGQGQGQGQPGQGNPSTGSGGGDKNVPFVGCGSGSGGEAAPCELPADDDMGGKAPAATEVEKWRARVSTATAVVKEASKGRGTVPGGMVELAQQLLTPSTTPWQRLLGAKIRRAHRRRSGTVLVDYTRRDRRRNNVTVGGKKVIYPGRSKPRLRVACIRDTSGSMGDRELAVATNEVVAISRRLHIRGPELLTIDVDARVHSMTGFTGFRSVQQVAGRGGTDMRRGIDYAMRLPEPPDVIVVLTDGGTEWPGEPTPVPVVACLIGPYAKGASAAVPGWIDHLVVEDPTA